MGTIEKRALSTLSPEERAGLSPTLRIANPAHPEWKLRPLALDIARATLTTIQRKVASGFLALDRALLALGVDIAPEELDFDTLTYSCSDHVLHLAISAGAEGIVRHLLRRGANPDARAGKDGLRPLHVAVPADDEDLINELLSRSADPDAPDARGRSTRTLAKFVAWKRGPERGHAILNGGWT